MSLQYLPAEILHEIFNQLGSEDLWCLFETSKAVRHCIAPMLLREARVVFKSDEASLNGRLLPTDIAFSVLTTWSSYVWVLRYGPSYSIPNRMITLLSQMSNLKHFSVSRPPNKASLNRVLLQVSALPALHKFTVSCGQPAAWRFCDGFQNLRCLKIVCLGCERGILLLPAFPDLTKLKLSFRGDCYVDTREKFPRVIVDLSRLPCLSTLEVEGIIEQGLESYLYFRGVSRSLRKFTANVVNGWQFWDNLECMSESLEEIRVRFSRDTFSGATELNFPRLKTFELESSIDCLPLVSYNFPSLKELNLKLGPGDFGYISRSVSVLRKLPVTLNLMGEDEFCLFDDGWDEFLEAQELEALAQLITLPNLRLGDDGNRILALLSL